MNNEFYEYMIEFHSMKGKKDVIIQRELIKGSINYANMEGGP